MFRFKLKGEDTFCPEMLNIKCLISRDWKTLFTRTTLNWLKRCWIRRRNESKFSQILYMWPIHTDANMKSMVPFYFFVCVMLQLALTAHRATALYNRRTQTNTQPTVWSSVVKQSHGIHQWMEFCIVWSHNSTECFKISSQAQSVRLYPPALLSCNFTPISCLLPFIS